MNSGSLHGVYGKNGRPKKSRQVDAFLNGAALTDDGNDDDNDGGNNIYGGTATPNNTTTAHHIRKVLSASDQQSSWNDQYTDTDVESSLNYNGSDLYGAETDDDDDDIATLETSSSISMSFDGSEQQDPSTNSSHREGGASRSRRTGAGTTSKLMNAFGACHPSTMSGSNPYGSSHTNDEEEDEEKRGASDRLKHPSHNDGRRGSHYISDVESSLAGDDHTSSSDDDSYVLSTRSYRMSRVLTGSSATNTNDDDNESTEDDDDDETDADGLTMIFNDIDHDLDDINTLVGSSTIGTTTNYHQQTTNHHHDGTGGLNTASTAAGTDAIIAPSNSNSAIEVSTMTKEQIDQNAAKRERRHYRHSSMPDPTAGVFVSVQKEDDPLPVPQAFTISRSFTSSSSSKNKSQLEHEMNQRRARAHLSKGSSDKERTSHVTKNSFMGTKPRSYRPTQSQGSSCKVGAGSIASSTASSKKKTKKQGTKNKIGNTARLPPSGNAQQSATTAKDTANVSSSGKQKPEDARSKANQVAFQKKVAAETDLLQKDPKAMKQMEKQRHKMEQKLVRAGSAKQMETYKALNNGSGSIKTKKKQHKSRGGGGCCSNWCCCKLWQIFQQAPCWVKVVLIVSLLIMKGSFAYLGYTYYKNYQQRAAVLEQQQNVRRGDINTPLSLETSSSLSMPTSDEPFISKASSSLRGSSSFAGVDPV